jgi:hypothetical protein
MRAGRARTGGAAHPIFSELMGKGDATWNEGKTWLTLEKRKQETRRARRREKNPLLPTCVPVYKYDLLSVMKAST